MSSKQSVRVWDLPTRLFHWALVSVLTGAFVSISVGAIDWHFRLGYALLALLVFRVLWGFAGPRYARFASFPPHPVAALAYLRGHRPISLGHNPLGAFSVYAFLLVLSAQAVLGLFANDGSFSEGPFAALVSGATSNLATRLHKWNQWLILALVGLHLAAILYYQLGRGERLVAAMWHGHRHGLSGSHPHAEDGVRTRVRALILALLASALVSYLVIA